MLNYPSLLLSGLLQPRQLGLQVLQPLELLDVVRVAATAAASASAVNGRVDAGGGGDAVEAVDELGVEDGVLLPEGEDARDLLAVRLGRLAVEVGEGLADVLAEAGRVDLSGETLGVRFYRD